MNSRIPRFRMVGLIAFGVAICALSIPLQADPPTYRIFMLGVLPGDNQSRALGLNDLGAVVGISTSPGSVKSYFWLFDPLYGFNSSFEMMPLASNAAANDINNAGIAVGRKPSGSGKIAHRWELDDGGVDEFSLGTLSTGGGEQSEAFAINDAANAVIVGESQYFDEDLPCSSSVTTAFKYIVGVSSQPGLFGSVGTQRTSAAFGLNNASDPLVVGTRPFETSCTFPLLPCQSLFDATAWASGTPAQLESVPDDQELLFHAAQDANDEGNIVGIATIDVDPDPSELICVRRAPFWASTGAAPVVLAADNPSDQAQANAITNLDACDMIRVVGQNSDDETALYWENDGSSWSVVLLQDRLLSTCLLDSLIEATDINENGWIVGYADTNPGGGQTVRAFLLLPTVEACYADLNGDCKVNGFDLAILLGDWNNSECADRTCWGDLDCSNGPDPDDTVGDVDSYDLAILLGEWTGNNLCSEDCVEGWGTCGGGSESAQSSSSSSEDEGTNPTLIAQLIGQLIGLGEIEAAAQLAELTASE